MVKVKDVYAGKPDAKDEVETSGMNSFLETYVMPDNFNVDALISGTGYFITGYKGTGKTALLYYLDDTIRKADRQACSSFIFFKGDYSDINKQEMDFLARRLTSAISISQDVVLESTDFEYIWRWLFYRKFIEDNELYNNGIFKNDKNWELFEKTISRVGCERRKHFLNIPPKVNLIFSMSDVAQANKIEQKIELDFLEKDIKNSEPYKLFTEIIDVADELFVKLERTDIPYYVFIDELEAYYGDDTVFKRDLFLIRDLIFTVKKLNQVLGLKSEVKTKMICSVRTEIVNAINRFIVSKEINKVISGFEVPLKWDYTNTNSFNHPILRILVKRIEYAERKVNEYKGEKKLIEKWFPEKIKGSDAANFLLNNSWCKPRDIVRLILSAQNCIGRDNISFSQGTIDLCHKGYSLDSLTELREEMKALYSAEEIDCIVTCLKGFKRTFTLEELRNRINQLYGDTKTVWTDKTISILEDLYRIGIIGNYSGESELYRWQHKGDDGIILVGWQIMVHAALQNALSVNNKQDRVINKNEMVNSVEIPEGTFVSAKIERILPKSVIASFVVNNVRCVGCAHKHQIADEYVENISDYMTVGEEYQAKVMGYSKEHLKWNLTFRLG